MEVLQIFDAHSEIENIRFISDFSKKNGIASVHKTSKSFIKYSDFSIYDHIISREMTVRTLGYFLWHRSKLIIL